MAARGSIDRGQSLGVLEFLYAYPPVVIIGCLVALAVIFAVDVVTPPADVFTTLYIVPAAAAAALLPSRSAVSVLACALGFQIAGLLLQRGTIPTILAGAGGLAFVFVVLRLLSVSGQRDNNRIREASARAAVSTEEPGTLDDQPRLFGVLEFLYVSPPRFGVAVSREKLGTLDIQLQSLTKREREVAGLVAEGRSAREIARKLHIGQRTVETHVARAYAKLGVSSRVDLILKRVASGNSWSRDRGPTS